MVRGISGVAEIPVIAAVRAENDRVGGMIALRLARFGQEDLFPVRFVVEVDIDKPPDIGGRR